MPDPTAHTLIGSSFLLFLALTIASCGSDGGDTPMQPAAPLGNDASLAALAISNIGLDPSFSSSVTNYAASVPNITSSVDISATAADSDASLTINGGVDTSIPLNVGENTIRILVTAENGTTTQTYTILVTRQSASTFAQAAYVKASNSESQDWFGKAVALSADGTTLAVGAPFEDSSFPLGETNNLSRDEGAVYVFTRDSAGTWAQQAIVKASNGTLDDQFGWSVALSADGAMLAVGAIFQSIDDLESEAISVENKVSSLGNAVTNKVTTLGNGAAYVFARDSGGVWTERAYLWDLRITGSVNWGTDAHGWSVSLADDGATLAVGAPGTSSSVGDVYVYTTDTGGVWTQQARINASNADVGDEFGYSVGLSADGATLAVGARGEDGATTGINGDERGNTAINSGAVYMFTRDGGGVWTQQAYVKASNTDGDDQFGASVTLADNGATLGVGASGEDSAASGINGDETNNTVTDSGAIYAFTQDDVGAWTQQAYIKASHLDADDFFGFSVVLSNDGTMLATGVRGEDSAATGVNGDESDNSATNSGAVYMFTRDSDDTWTELAYLKASNADVADFLGRSVALSDPGATLVVAVGAGGEDSIATGVNGDETDNNAESSGAAYVFER